MTGYKVLIKFFINMDIYVIQQGTGKRIVAIPAFTFTV